MKCVRLLATTLLVAISMSGMADASEQELRNSVVYISSIRVPEDDSTRVEERDGTGFVVSDQGHVLTANHVVFEPADGYVVRTTASFGSGGNHAYTLEFIDNNENVDLALLILPQNIDHPYVPIEKGDSRKMKVEDSLKAYGFLDGQDLTYADGKLSAFPVRRGQWRTTIGLNHGQSGGPVLNSEDQWVAVAVAGDSAKKLVTYAIPEAHSTPLLLLADVRRPATAIATFPVTTTSFDYVAAIRQGEFDENLQRFCLPDGYKVSAASFSPDSGGAAQGVSIRRVTGAINCVEASINAEASGSNQTFNTRIDVLGESNKGAIKANALEPAIPKPEQG